MIRTTGRPPRRRLRLRLPSPSLLVATGALLFALGGPAWAESEQRVRAGAAPTVTVVTHAFQVSNGQVQSGAATCPKGTRAFSGAYASNGQHARIFAAGPSRKENGYLVYAVSPPVNITAGVTRETAKITAFAWCARVGRPIVLGGS